MRLSDPTVSNGIVSYELYTEPDVTGKIWHAEEPDGPAPVILGSHGGGQSVQAPGVAARATRYAAQGFVVVALNAPGHGDRPRTAEDQDLVAALGAARGDPAPFARAVAALNASIAGRAVPEWVAVLDAVAESGLPARTDSVGFSGLSLGAAIGLNVTAREPRIRAASLGLIGDALVDIAAQVDVPVEFLVQWDDELVARDSAIRLFDAIGSAEKTLHANPGPHGGVPAFEIDSSVRFFSRHLMGRSA